ncbi:penicillin-binding protein 1C [Marinilabiliaceae bacterium ANBcel2]|nr:penicillin-binding protein 1C [Marinilabiliaceae bacterium ANBcel2]
MILYRYRYCAALLLFLFILFLLIPPPQFNTPRSTVVFGKGNYLLGAHIAHDEQWRFPAPDSLPHKYKKALITFEDRYFYYHPGVNPISIIKALINNVKANKITGGGSTISMQVARMADNNPRTIRNKIWEMLRALRLETGFSKKDILIMYAANAPFGGNVVGLEGAAWHYFERAPHNLTWAESALLAVLPNAPGVLRPDANRERLKDKRDKLLKELYQNGSIDKTELMLSQSEPLPTGRRRMPNSAPHLVGRLSISQNGEIIHTTIDPFIQERMSKIVNNYSRQLKGNQIDHAAAIIADIETGNVLGYVGNSNGNGDGHAVDMIRASRSSGSILKPFLHAAALQNGTILPQMLIEDVPVQYRDYTPRNFYRRYYGAVPANEALTRSLNIPYVKLLDDYGGERFLKLLNKMGMTTLNKGYSHYGLSLILGGGESMLWELAGAYASMGRTVNSFTNSDAHYFKEDFKPLNIDKNNGEKRNHIKEKKSATKENSKLNHPPVLSAGAIWHTLEAMKGVVRPPQETGWENFTRGQNIAWKTGTSYGYRDAWSIGLNSRFVVAVWTGNAGGEGRPGLTGGTAAAPLMFQLFTLLEGGSWFNTPHDDLVEIEVCKKSGYRASQMCIKTEERLMPLSVRSSSVCPFHKLVHLTPDERFQTSKLCREDGDIKSKSFFVLPPLMAWYYRQYNSDYRTLPPFEPGCNNNEFSSMDFIYPHKGTTIITPKDLDTKRQSIVFKIVHNNPEATVFWHLNNSYITSTKREHQLELDPGKGVHVITAIDSDGNRISRNFRVLK